MKILRIKRGIFSIFIVILLIVISFRGILIFKSKNDNGSVEAVTTFVDWSGSGHYTTIQAAIDDASSGDTIIVANGTYYESITINKSNIKLMGNSTTDCKIIYHYEGTNYLNNFAAGINVTAPNVETTGFNIIVTGNYTYGICLNSSSTNSNITNNNISTTGNWGHGIFLYQSLNITLKNNTINTSGRYGYGMYLYDSSNNNNFINNKLNTFGQNSYGIYLYESSNNNLINNVINTSGQNGDGIWLYLYSNNNKLIDNTINTSGQSGNGIYIWRSSSINLTYNIINIPYGWGIQQKDSINNDLIGNIINASGDSICLDSTKGMNLSGNNLTSTGIEISGDSIDHWNTHAIDTLNMVNTKPVYYYRDTNGVSVPTNVGEVIIANCTNMSVSNRNFTNAGIFLAYSKNSEVIDNTFSFNGINLYYSNNNNLTNNNIKTIRKSMYGIYLIQSSNNNLMSNTINTSGDYAYGIYQYESSNNNLIYNTINTTGEHNFGIHLYGASNNNDIMDNKIKTIGEYGCGIILVGDVKQLFGPSYNKFKGNIITTYGEIGYGISQGEKSKNNKFINNNISTFGQNGYGIRCGGGSNYFINNSIKTYGERGYGIHKAGDGNNLIGNTIITYGERGDGIYDNMGGGITINNHITTTGGGYGIFIVNLAQRGKIIENYINTTGAFGHGIYLYRNGNYNDVIDNIVNVKGSNSHGIRLRRKAKYNNIIGNTVNTSEQSGYGIYLENIANNNLLSNNSINTKGSNMHGIYIDDSANNNALSNNTIYTTGVEGHGISIANSINTYVSNCNITTTNTSAHGFCLNGNSAIITDSTITTASGSNDFKAINDGEITAINCSFKNVQVTQNGGGVLKVKNYLDVQVIDDDSITLISGVNVEVRDNNAQIYGSPGFGGTGNTTNAYGRIGQVTVTDRWYNHNNIATENETTIKVKKMFDELWEVERLDVDMSTSHTEIFYYDIAAPPVPTGLKVTRVPETNTLNIYWDLNLDTVDYTVYSNKSGVWNLIYNITHPQNWTLDADLEDQIWYYYRIQAWDKVGLSSGISEVVSYYLIDIIPPVIPTGLTVKPVPGGDALNISWDLNPDNPLDYDITWKEPITNEWTWLDKVIHPKNWYIWSHQSLTNGTIYYFAIRACYQDILPSLYSSPVGGIHRDYLSPAPPSNLKAEAINETIINLNWERSSDLDVEGYMVYMNRSGTGSGGPYLLIARVKDFDYVVKGLLENTVYYFVTKAFDEANNTSPFSDESSEITYKILIRPRIISTNPNQNCSDIAVTSSITIIFSIPMNITSVAYFLIIKPNVEYNLTWIENHTILFINFIVNLSYNKSYSVEIGEVRAATGTILEHIPFVLRFRTVQEIIPFAPIIKITSPVVYSVVKLGDIITVSGSSIGLDTGTEIRVTLGDETTTGIIDANGKWSIEIMVPNIEGKCEIIAAVGNHSDQVSITVDDPDGEDDDTIDGNDKDDDKGVLGLGIGQIIALILILVIINIITILLAILMKKKKTEVEEGTDEKGSEEGEEKELEE